MPLLERKGTVSLSSVPIPPSVYPCIEYDDVEAAVTYLTEKVGGVEHLLVRDEATGVAHHAEVRLGANGFLIMDRRKSSEARLAGRAHVYVYVKDVTAHYEAALEKGAAMCRQLEDRGPAGKSYACEDAEGNKYTFGNYLP